MARDRRRPVVVIARQEHPRVAYVYRAELWVWPFRGWMVAATMWRSRRGWAMRDAQRVFQADRPFEILTD